MAALPPTLAALVAAALLAGCGGSVPGPAHISRAVSSRPAPSTTSPTPTVSGTASDTRPDPASRTLDRLAASPGDRYTSDGDPAVISFPARLAGDFAPIRARKGQPY